MKRISFNINCEEKTCGHCQFLVSKPLKCKMFDQILRERDPSEPRWAIRLPECIQTQVKEETVPLLLEEHSAKCQKCGANGFTGPSYQFPSGPGVYTSHPIDAIECLVYRCNQCGHRSHVKCLDTRKQEAQKKNSDADIEREKECANESYEATIAWRP